eukprot:7909862-Karenia_brevis.AAC.1
MESDMPDVPSSGVGSGNGFPLQSSFEDLGNAADSQANQHGSGASGVGMQGQGGVGKGAYGKGAPAGGQGQP